MPNLHKVRKIEPLGRHTFRVVLERNDFKFTAGQCVNIGLPGSGINREYSSYSSETADELVFLIREVDGGTVTPALKKLKAGDQVEVDGPYGEFWIRTPNDGRKYYFVASGTGIAPFHCFVKTYPKLDYQIIHGVRTADEQYDRADFEGGSRYAGCVSQGTGGDFKGRVTGYLTEKGVDKNGVYYLCGNRGMINDVYDLLREKGVSGTNIITETFF